MNLPSLLIEQDAESLAQPLLFSLPADVEGKLDLDGQYTAERLFHRRPDTYRTVVNLLRQGTRIRAIKRACHVHHSTIAAVAEREKIAIDTGKERILADLRLAQSVLAESIIEDVMEGDLKPEAKAIALGIITEKIELLSGGVTQRIETQTTPTDSPRTWDDWMDRVKRVQGSDTGLGVGETGANGAVALDGPARVHRLPSAAADMPSVVITRTGPETTGLTTSTPAEQRDHEDSDLGGAGVSEPGGGRPGPTV